MLQLTDQSVKIHRGCIEDVLVQIENFCFPADFIVIDICGPRITNRPTPIILGRPFLATHNALIDYRTGLMKITFGNMSLDLNIFNVHQSCLMVDKHEEANFLGSLVDTPHHIDPTCTPSFMDLLLVDSLEPNSLDSLDHLFDDVGENFVCDASVSLVNHELDLDHFPCVDCDNPLTQLDNGPNFIGNVVVVVDNFHSMSVYNTFNFYVLFVSFVENFDAHTCFDLVPSTCVLEELDDVVDDNDFEPSFVNSQNIIDGSHFLFDDDFSLQEDLVERFAQHMHDFEALLNQPSCNKSFVLETPNHEPHDHMDLLVGVPTLDLPSPIHLFSLDTFNDPYFSNSLRIIILPFSGK